MERDHPYVKDVLVSAEWVAQRLDSIQSDDPSLRLVEVDLNMDFYEQGHVPGAVGLHWHRQLRHRHRRDVPTPSTFSDVLSTQGIDNSSTVIVYGDNSNWFAAHFYWLLKYYGHEDVYLLNGGREYWIESGYPTSTTTPTYPKRAYTTSGPNEGIRAYKEDVERAIERDTSLVDVRLPEEYDGTVVAPPGVEEHAQRGGHIPGAVNVVWAENLKPDGRFKSRKELEALYHDYGVTDDGSVIAYCRIGERSSLTWFVLSELLGFQSVTNYDGSWTEWGNLIGAPIETGDKKDSSSAPSAHGSKR